MSPTAREHQKPWASPLGGPPARQTPPPGAHGVSEQQVSSQRAPAQRPDRQSPPVTQAERGAPVPPGVRPTSAAGWQNAPPPAGGIQQTDPGSGSQSLEVQQVREQRLGPAPPKGRG